jgi:hypothetical protein
MRPGLSEGEIAYSMKRKTHWRCRRHQSRVLEVGRLAITRETFLLAGVRLRSGN